MRRPVRIYTLLHAYGDNTTYALVTGAVPVYRWYERTDAGAFEISRARAAGTLRIWRRDGVVRIAQPLHYSES
jgi:hypothetical protein